MKKYNILFASHPDYSGNAKALYKYMNKNCPDFNLFWVSYEENSYKIMKKNKISCYMYDSKEFKKIFESIDIVFFTHDELLEYKTENQIFIYLGHGNSAKKFGLLLKEKQLAIQDKKYLDLMKNNIDYIICSSELWQILYHAIFNLNLERILPLGTPRTDFIYTENGKENLKKCNIDISKYKKIFMYLPTFRNGLGRQNEGLTTDNVLNIEEYDENELEQFLEENNYLLIVKYHPYEINKRKFTDYKNITVLEDNELSNNLLSLTEIINAIDLIIADYSSAFSDFVILDKPVCFLNNDLDEYKKNRGIIFDDIDFWSPGPYIKTLKDFEKEVSKLLKDKNYFQKERKQYVNINFGNNKNYCAKNIVDFLFNDKEFEIFENKKNIIEKEKISLYDENINLKTKNNILDEENKKINENLIQTQNELYQKNNELEIIYTSRGYRFLEKFRKIIYKLRGGK